MTTSKEQIERQKERSRRLVERGKWLQQGICPTCRQSIKFVQVGREVYTSCRHYHWQGRV